MNTSENPHPSRKPFMSPEALIGLGVTLAELGGLGLLLGWAQYMRSVPAFAMIWLALGALFFVIGTIMALAGSRARRR